MWLLLAVLSAILLGLYDVAKKQALRKNGVLTVLLVATAFSTLFLCPFLRVGPLKDHLQLLLKAVLVTASWVSGLAALKLLPLTTVSTFKGSRPVFVVLFSVLIFGEKLDWMQWLGVAIVLGALFLLGHTSRKDAPAKVRRVGFIYLGISILTGVASALYDKHIMSALEPLFVQSWTNLFITLLLALCVLVRRLVCHSERSEESVSPPLENTDCRDQRAHWSRSDRSNVYRLGGPSCLSGDVIGDYCFDHPLREGDLVLFGDLAIYSTCKNNTFNGMPLPDIYRRREDGTIEKLTDFGYRDFKYRLGR